MKAKDLPKAEYLWDFYCRTIPEDSYEPLEDAMAPYLGKDILFKKDFDQVMRTAVNGLYDAIKHGDEEHQNWLKEKMEAYFYKSPNPQERS